MSVSGIVEHGKTHEGMLVLQSSRSAAGPPRQKDSHQTCQECRPVAGRRPNRMTSNHITLKRIMYIILLIRGLGEIEIMSATFL